MPVTDNQNHIRPPRAFPELWQPIASAPRDGTFVLTRVGPWQPCITHWATYDGKTRWGSNPEDFMEEDHFLQYWHAVSYEPTHWMPLPDDDVADAIETAYRNGFEDGERHAGEAAAIAQSYAAPVTSVAAQPPDERLGRLVKALGPFADLEAAIGPQRAFVQLLVCPDGDDHKENWSPKIREARAVLAVVKEGDRG